jgi:hypothetical protein
MNATGPAGEGTADEVGSGVDPSAEQDALPGAAELREMWERYDPVPPGLADRVSFALEVDAFTRDDLDLELLRLQARHDQMAGARGDDGVRTVTFGSDAMTVMLAISDVEGGFRIDGWVAPGGARAIEVRTSAGSRAERSDDTGRFALPLVPPGHFQLVLESDPDQHSGHGQHGGSSPAHGPGVARAVVTPALTL